MKREEIEPFVGLGCRVHWRDPEGDSGWTDKPLKDRAYTARTWCTIIGFNEDDDLVIVGTESRDNYVSGRDVIPIALIEKIEKIAVEP